MSLFSTWQNGSQQEGLSEFLRLLKKGGGLIVLVTTLTTLLVGYVALQFRDDQYESGARLLVRLGRENAEIPVTIERGSIYSNGVRPEDINSEIQLLKSSWLIERVIDDVGLGKFSAESPRPVGLIGQIKYQARLAVRSTKARLRSLLVSLDLTRVLTDRQNVALLLERSTTVQREKDSNVISVSIKLPSPDLCVELLNSLLAQFLKARIEVNAQGNARGFFEDQFIALSRELELLEQERRRLRAEQNVSLADDQRRLILGRLNDLYGKISATVAARTVLEGPSLALDEERSRRFTALSQGEAPFPALDVDELQRRLVQLRIDLLRTSSVYGEMSDVIQEGKLEIARTANLLERALTARVELLRTQAGELEAQLLRLDAGEAAVRDVDRRIAAAESNYYVYAKRREESRISEELDKGRVANIAVISPPRRPIRPAPPQRLLILKLCGVLGLMLGVVLVLTREYFSDVIHGERDLSSFKDVAVLGSIKSAREPSGPAVPNRDEFESSA